MTGMNYYHETSNPEAPEGPIFHARLEVAPGNPGQNRTLRAYSRDPHDPNDHAPEAASVISLTTGKTHTVTFLTREAALDLARTLIAHAEKQTPTP